MPPISFGMEPPVKLTLQYFMDQGGAGSGCTASKADWSRYGEVVYRCGLVLTAAVLFQEIGPMGRAMGLAHARHHLPGHKATGQITEYQEVDEEKCMVSITAWCDCKVE